MPFPHLKYEKKLQQQGCRVIAGVDEAGRGPLAGPVVAAAVILPNKFCANGINDSKKLSDKQRRHMYGYIMQNAVAVGIGIVDSRCIDKINILQAAKMAMLKAVNKTGQKVDHLLIDGNQSILLSIPQTCVIKGDRLSLSIAAASIVAKVTRDNIMLRMHSKYPQYKFNQHKGYGTAEHFKLLQKHGPCPIHRCSWDCVS